MSLSYDVSGWSISLTSMGGMIEKYGEMVLALVVAEFLRIRHM
jgi:hypothetical protein